MKSFAIITIATTAIILSMGTNVLADTTMSNRGSHGIFIDETNSLVTRGYDILTGTTRDSVLIGINDENSFEFYSTPVTNFNGVASIIKKTDHLTSSHTTKFDVGGGVTGKLTGSFSYNSESTKDLMTFENHEIVSIKSVYKLGEIHVIASNTVLSPDFHQIISDIGIHLEKNTTTSLIGAIKLTDRLIAKYGTHIVTSQEIGGILRKDDAIDKKGSKSVSTTDISRNAKASFMSFVKASGSSEDKSSTTKTYDTSVTTFNIYSVGGEWDYSPSYTYYNWTQSVKKSPGTIGVSVSSITSIIDANDFDKLSEDTISEVIAMITDRTNKYVKSNTYYGCDNELSPSFRLYANLFSPNFCKLETTYHFGGFFTIGSMHGRPYNGFSVKNLITQDYSCPNGYVPMDFMKNSFRKQTGSNEVCHKHFLGHRHCHTEYFYGTVSTNTKICVSKDVQKKGTHFGGAFTNSLENAVTGIKKCPSGFSNFPIYHDGNKKLVTTICIATFDSNVDSYPFGGIFSAQFPNYVSSNASTITAEFACPPGHTRYSVGSNPIAEITYCLATTDTSSHKALKPPGYGTRYAEEAELYTIYDFKNGTFVGIEVNPSNPDSYFDQVETKAENLAMVDSDGTATRSVSRSFDAEFVTKHLVDVRDATNDEDSNECYLEKWMKAHDIDTIIQKNRGTDEISETADSTKSKPTDSTDSSEIIDNSGGAEGSKDDGFNQGEAVGYESWWYAIVFGGAILAIVAAVMFVFVFKKTRSHCRRSSYTQMTDLSDPSTESA